MLRRLSTLAAITLLTMSAGCLDEPSDTAGPVDAGVDVRIVIHDTWGSVVDTGATTSPPTDTGTTDPPTDTGTADPPTDTGTADTGTTDTGTSLSCGPTMTCADARLTAPGTRSGTTAGTGTYALSCANSSGAPEYVVHFTSETAGTYTFSTAGSGFDTVLSVRDGDCGGAELGCNDDTVARTSEVRVTLAACQSVAVIIDGYENAAGAFQLSVTTSEAACDDGLDNDADGLSDCDDPDCSRAPGCDSWPSDWAQLEIDMLAETNRHRGLGANCGGTEYPPVGPLEMDEAVQRAARLHSKDMADNDFFDHVSQDGRTFSTRMSNEGFSGAMPWGENIAAGNSTAEAILTQWMNSPGHCSNIMNGAYHVIGIGYASGPATYGSYSTQDFAASH